MTTIPILIFLDISVLLNIFCLCCRYAMKMELYIGTWSLRISYFQTKRRHLPWRQLILASLYSLSLVWVRSYLAIRLYTCMCVYKMGKDPVWMFCAGPTMQTFVLAPTWVPYDPSNPSHTTPPIEKRSLWKCLAQDLPCRLPCGAHLGPLMMHPTIHTPLPPFPPSECPRLEVFDAHLNRPYRWIEIIEMLHGGSYPDFQFRTSTWGST